MAREPSAEYDVIIMGGGPAGSTLGALLAKRTDLRVAIFEKERFPREHIGESFATQMVPVLEESGALEKILASDCWVKKYGGFFAWAETPMAAFFDGRHVIEDGVYRYSVHANRPEFDEILLRHAADLGVDVFEETPVSDFASDADGCTVTLKDGRTVRASYFADASGRRNSIAAKQKREWLSHYRNIAVWQHFLDCEPAQNLSGDWNIFRPGDHSALGAFAFENGWVWYIPVPKIIDGERRMTHSIGIVTLPEILKEEGTDFTDQKTFIETIKSVRHLEELVKNAVPIAEKMITATNYSMINEQFADFDKRWILVGDSSFFVDPLFSSGVAFATNQAAGAALLLQTALSGEFDEQAKRDLWRDYDEGWHGMAETFALSIDGWYHALGKDNPDSVYWQRQGSSPYLDVQERTFEMLLDTTLTANLLEIVTSTPVQPQSAELESADTLRLAPGVTIRETIGLDLETFKAFAPAGPMEASVDAKTKAANAKYWSDPVANGSAVTSPVAAPATAYRFHFAGGDDAAEVRGLAREGAEELVGLLRAGDMTAQQLEEQLTLHQRQLLKRLVGAGLVTSGAA